MKIGIAIIIFFLSIIALVFEFILYMIFGIGAAFSGGGISSLMGVAYFFVSLMILTIATGVLAPVCAVIEMIANKYIDFSKIKHKKPNLLRDWFLKDIGTSLLVIFLTLILIFLIVFSSSGMRAVKEVESIPEVEEEAPAVSPIGIEEEKGNTTKEETGMRVPKIRETGMIVTVNSAKKQRIIGECGEYDWGCDVAGSGKTFLIVDVTIENKGVTGLYANYVSPSNFEIKDQDGYVYSYSYTSNLEQELPSTKLSEGDKVRGKIAFEIPTTVTGLKLTIDKLVIPLE